MGVVVRAAFTASFICAPRGGLVVLRREPNDQKTHTETGAINTDTPQVS